MRNLLDVNDLTIAATQTDTILVDRVTFSVRRNETLGLVGFSAAGKTLTALSLFRLLPDTVRIVSGSARIEVQGKIVDTLSASESLLGTIRGVFVAYIFQEPRKSLNPVYPVGRQIEELFVYHPQGSSQQPRRQTLEALQQVGFTHPERIYHCFPHQLSGGECQRVIIACALVLKPSLIIADEPTASLDVTTEALVVGLLRDVRKSIGASLLFITHNLPLLRKIADRMVFINQGKICGEVTNGDDVSVYAQIQDPYIRDVLKSMPSFQGKRLR
jgi:microcin C transport system ATP-binding protein